jgi:hypothetical protein
MDLRRLRQGAKVHSEEREGAMRYLALLIPLAASAAGCSGDDDSPTGPSGSRVSFFVTSQTSVTGNLGGLAGADATCRQLATAAGHGANRIWRAYLSVERGPEGQPIHARDRIGPGPWHNSQLQLLANNTAEMHAREGDAALFLDERAQRINGQWTGSPGPVEHDILTGSNADGTLAAGFTCADWTSDSAAAKGWVGHSDGFGPGQSRAGALASWNSAHDNQNCANTAPRGGAGRFYCFAQ